MVDHESVPQDESLLLGSSVAAAYSGEGVLTVPNSQSMSCTFRAYQLSTSRIILICSITSDLPPFFRLGDQYSYMENYRIEGTTYEGAQILSESFSADITDYANLEPNELAYQLQRLSVHFPTNEQARSTRIGLTNFRFTDAGDQGRHAFSVNIAGLPEIRLESVEHYDQIMARVRTCRGVDVTCELSLDIPHETSDEQLMRSVNNICYPLSIARGTRVQYIYRNDFDENTHLVSRIHYWRGTDAFNGAAVIRTRSGEREDWKTKEFIELTYANFVAKLGESAAFQRAIDAYLAAKSEHDHVAMKAVKVAVSMEMVRAIFVVSLVSQKSREDLILKRSDWKGLLRVLKTYLEDNISDKAVADEMRQKVGSSLNSKSFKSILRILRDRQLGVIITDDEIKRFVDSRNELIHYGRFLAEKDGAYQPLPVLAEEHDFLIKFLDRIIFKLIGYDLPPLERTVQFVY